MAGDKGIAYGDADETKTAEGAKTPQRVVISNGQLELVRYRCPDCNGLYENPEMAVRRNPTKARCGGNSLHHACKSRPPSAPDEREPEVEAVLLIQRDPSKRGWPAWKMARRIAK